MSLQGVPAGQAAASACLCWAGLLPGSREDLTTEHDDQCQTWLGMPALGTAQEPAMTLVQSLQHR